MDKVQFSFTNGYVGMPSRSVDNVIISRKNASSAAIPYGAAVFLKSDGTGVLPYTSGTTTGPQFLGFAVRVPDKSPETYGSNLGQYNENDPVDILVRGSVVLPLVSTAARSGDSVYVRVADGKYVTNINTAISGVWMANDCASDALPNHILIPVEQFGMLVTRKVSDGADKSVLTYVLENDLAAQQGVNLIISPCKWCAGIGSSGTDRMVVYMNRVDRLCFNLTQPLRRMDTEYADMRVKIPYFSQFSEVRFLYPTTVRYMDGI